MRSQNKTARRDPVVLGEWLVNTCRDCANNVDWILELAGSPSMENTQDSMGGIFDCCIL